MSTVAELLVKIGADSSDLRKEIAATKRQLKTAFGSEGLNLSGKAVNVLEGFGAALGALGIYAVKAGGELQNVQVAMTNMLGSAEKATAFVKELQDFAANTPFEFNDVTKASQKFLAFGFTAEQIIPTLTAVGDAAAGVGAGQDGVNRLTIALGQIAAKGKLASQEIMQITELGIPAWQLLADKLGTDVATAQDMVTKRMVDSQMALDALVGGMENRYGGMMEQQSGTIIGTWSNLMDGLGQLASQTGLAIAEALNLPELFSSIGEWLSNFAAVLQEGGIREAILSCIPPEVQLAIIAFGTALTGIAIPAMYAAGIAALAMAAPFITAIGAAVATAAPFIAVITAIGAVLYTLWANGVSVADVFQLMGVKTEVLFQAGSALQSAFSALGNLFSSVLTALRPLFVAFGTVVAVVVTGILQYFGNLITGAAYLLTMVATAIEGICSVFEWMVNGVGSALEAVASALGGMADSVLPAWASSGLSTISNFVNSATGWLSGLISKIFETNAALNNVGEGNSEDGANSDSAPKKELKKPDFSNFKGSSGGAVPSGGGKGGSGSIGNTATQAANTSKSIEEEWVRTFNTKSQLVERWYQEESAELEKSKTANENYERDKQRLVELYAQKRITALQEEAKKIQDIRSSISAASFASKAAGSVLNADAAAAELVKMKLEHEKTLDGIEERWTNLSNTFIGLTDNEKEVFLQALKERSIAFEQSESGELDFHKQMLKDKLAEDKAYEDTKAEYHAQCKDIQANIDEAYRTNDLARLKEVLTEEAAMRLNDMEAQKTMMDTYQQAFLDAHATISQMVTDLYGTALTGLEDAFTNILTNAKSAKDAFADLGKSMLKVIAQYFAKQAAGMILSHVMGQNIQKKEAATSVAQSAAELSAWAPVAVAYETVHPGSAARALGMVTASLTTAAALGASLLAVSSIGTGTKSSANAISVQGYAKGGYFTGPALGIIGEGIDNEVALPLNKAVFNNIAEGIVEAGANRNATVTQNIYGDINDAADVNDLFEGLSNIVAVGLRGV
ncbi:tape measure protein [Phascolarctobacterium faecium]|uniref:tape measure protein n=1 Tax=Phascolarctobacterium faecium TaxID=33025 RepID=UPI002068C5E7|nr:MAG TPA: tail tape measure protein [Caudoviricetes sp.]